VVSLMLWVLNMKEIESKLFFILVIVIYLKKRVKT
jgi:hypothetical protein